MKEKKRRSPRRLDDRFKYGILKEYYESGCSMASLCRKYSLNSANVRRWEREFASKVLPLPADISEVEARVFMGKIRKARQDRASKEAPALSEEERLREENARLRKALEYSELRNDALNTVLRIGREQYGVDLLKKVGAKQ